MHNPVQLLQQYFLASFFLGKSVCFCEYGFFIICAIVYGDGPVGSMTDNV
ncbi:MAG: hypothetical protein KatS3mg031_0590 [Chitinophagales bacterium]|nr:MAG: hypothetical protein KatS3mg031_0590 [Chitinophagales bacterium]